VSDPEDTAGPRPDQGDEHPADPSPPRTDASAAPPQGPPSAPEQPDVRAAAEGQRRADGAVPPHAQQMPLHFYHHQPSGPRRLPPNPRWHRSGHAADRTAFLLTAAVALFGAWAAFHDEGVGIGLSSVASIRDAGWVVALCSLAAFALTPVVLAPQRRFSGHAIVLLFGWLEGVAESLRWAKRGRRSRGGAGTTRVLWTALVTAGLLIVFGGLFAAADSTFAGLMASLTPDLNPVEVFLRLALAAVLFPLALVWIYTAVAKPRFEGDERGARPVVSRFELAIPLGALNLLFAAFIAVQLRVYVGGESYVMETAGLTFAEYARRGFWQLSFVAALVLGVIALAAWLAPRRAGADRWTLRLLLGPLCLMSLVVIASALYRMYTYFETFGLTRLRVWVFTVEIWLAVLFVLVLACCWKLRAAWLPRAILASGALALLGLAAADPDALIARYNIDHEHRLDLAYLRGLSDDAVPALMELSGEERECALGPFAHERGERPLMAWNLGRHRADGLLAQREDDWDPCALSPVYGDFGEDIDRSDRPGATAEAPDPASAEGSGFFHWDTCARYDLAGVTELFGTSAKGDRGVVPDDPSQYAEDLDPVLDRGDRVLHCGYYGPGMDYLMVETYRWPTAAEAEDGLRSMQADQEQSGVYSVAPFPTGGAVGYIATQDSTTGTYEYAAAVDETVVVVSLSGSVFGDGAEAVCADLVEQTRELYSAAT
jgi:hypothetical protein